MLVLAVGEDGVAEIKPHRKKKILTHKYIMNNKNTHYSRGCGEEH